MKRFIATVLIGALAASPAYALRTEGPQGVGLEELEQKLGRPISRRRAALWAVGAALGAGTGAGLWAGTTQLVRAQDLESLRGIRRALQTLPWGFPGSASAEIVGPRPMTSPGKSPTTVYWITLVDKLGRPAEGVHQYVVLNLEHTRPETLILALRAVIVTGANTLHDVATQTLTLDRRQLDALSLQQPPNGPSRALIALSIDQPAFSAQPFQHLVVGIQTDPQTTSAVPSAGVAYTHDALWQYEPERAIPITSLAGLLASSTSSAVLPVVSGGVVGLGIGELLSHEAVRELVRDGLRRLRQDAPGVQTPVVRETLPPAPPRDRGLEIVSDCARNAGDPRAIVVLSDATAKQFEPVLALLRMTRLTYRYSVLPKVVAAEGLSQSFIQEIIRREQNTPLPIHLYGDRREKAVASAESQLKRPETIAATPLQNALTTFLLDLGVPEPIVSVKVPHLMEVTGLAMSVAHHAGLEEGPPDAAGIRAIPESPRMLTTVQRGVSFTKQNRELLRSIIVGPGAVGILPVLALTDRTWDFRVIPRDAEQARRVRAWMSRQGLRPDWVLEAPETFSHKTYLSAVRNAQKSLLNGERVASSALLVQGFHDLKIAIPRSEQQPVVRDVIVLPSRDDLLPLKMHTFLPLAYGRDIQDGMDVLMDEVRRVDHYLLGNL